MQLEQISVAVRPRRHWEAVDLGFTMARHWAGPLYKIWFSVTLPIFLLLCLLPTAYSAWTMIIFWWLKPLFERPLLFFLSQALFGETPSLGQAIRAFPSLAWKQLLLSLTWRRLSPTRSMDLPVLQLEGLKSKTRQARLGVLHRGASSEASWLTIIGVHIEFFLTLSLIALIWLFYSPAC